MQQLTTWTYEGYTTYLLIEEKVMKYLQQQHVDILKYLPDAEAWYERELFDLLDQDDDDKPDMAFGKEFDLMFFSIIENSPFAKPQQERVIEDAIYTGSVAIESVEPPFAVKYSIVMHK